MFKTRKRKIWLRIFESYIRNESYRVSNSLETSITVTCIYSNLMELDLNNPTETIKAWEEKLKK